MHQAYHLETMYKDVNISTGLLEEVTDRHRRSDSATPAQRTLTQTKANSLLLCSCSSRSALRPKT